MKQSVPVIVNCIFCNSSFKIFERELKRGRGKFCSKNCFSKYLKGKPNIALITHGFSVGEHHPFYNIYSTIKARCNNVNSNSWYLYGGRGITCLWKSFEEFRDDMYKDYLAHIIEYGEKQTTIDRIDNNGNYEKANCKWATRREQCRNRRSNRWLTFQGKTMCMKDWSEYLGIPMSTIYNRIIRNWSIEKILEI